MKKVCALVLSLIVCLVAVSAQQMPQFTDGDAYVFDLNAVEGTTNIRDEIRLESYMRETNVHVKIYLYDDKASEWVLCGNSVLKEFGDTDAVDSPYNKKLNKFRWCAILVQGVTGCTFTTQKSHHDLYVGIHANEEASDSEIRKSAYIIDTSKFGRSFSDRVRFISETDDKDCVFFIYASDDEKGPWKLVGTALLKEFNDKDFMDTPYASVSSFKYLAIVNQQGKSYTYETSVAWSDLIITVK